MTSNQNGDNMAGRWEMPSCFAMLGRLSRSYCSPAVWVTWGYCQFLPSYLKTLRFAFVKSSLEKDVSAAALRESLSRKPVLNHSGLAGLTAGSGQEKIFFGLDWGIKKGSITCTEMIGSQHFSTWILFARFHLCSITIKPILAFLKWTICTVGYQYITPLWALYKSIFSVYSIFQRVSVWLQVESVTDTENLPLS